MIAWLKRMFVGAPPVRAPLPVLTEALDAAPAGPDPAIPAPLHVAAIDRQYYRLLSGGIEGAGSAALEKTIWQCPWRRASFAIISQKWKLPM